MVVELASCEMFRNCLLLLSKEALALLVSWMKDAAWSRGSKTSASGHLNSAGHHGLLNLTHCSPRPGLARQRLWSSGWPG
jgi:hypothetical protein